MQRLPRLVELLLIVVLCGVLALWATRVLRGTPIAVPPVAAAPAAASDDRVEAVLASARLFGSRRPGVLSDNVRALGVVADASGQGSVIVSVDGQPAKVYRVGDTLDGRRVSAIRADEIELESGGSRQTFRLPPPHASAPGVTVAADPRSAPAPSMSAPVIATPAPGAPSVPEPRRPSMPDPSR